MTRPSEGSQRETGSRSRARRRAARRLPHLKALAAAADETKLLTYQSGATEIGEDSPFERVAREVLAERQLGRLTDADVTSLGLREESDGSLWIRVGPRVGRG